MAKERIILMDVQYLSEHGHVCRLVYAVQLSTKVGGTEFVWKLNQFLEESSGFPRASLLGTMGAAGYIGHGLSPITLKDLGDELSCLVSGIRSSYHPSRKSTKALDEYFKALCHCVEDSL